MTIFGLSPSLPLTVSERVRVIELAGKLRVKEVMKTLARLLKKSPIWDEVHSKEIWALGEIGGEEAVPEIVPYTGDFNRHKGSMDERKFNCNRFGKGSGWQFERCQGFG